MKSKEKIRSFVEENKNMVSTILANTYYSLIEDDPGDNVFRDMMNNPEEYNALAIKEQQEYVYIPDNYSVDGLTEALIYAVRYDDALATMNCFYRDYDYDFGECDNADDLWYYYSCYLTFSYPLEIEDANYWFYVKIEDEIIDSLIRIGEVDEKGNSIPKEGEGTASATTE